MGINQRRREAEPPLLASAINSIAAGRLAEEQSDGVRVEPKASLQQPVPPHSWGLAWREGSGVGGKVAGAHEFGILFPRFGQE